MKERAPVVQFSIREQTRKRLEKVADYNGQNMTATFVNMVNASYEKLPKDAK